MYLREGRFFTIKIDGRMRVQGQIVDIPGRRIFPGELEMEAGRVLAVHELDSAPEYYIMPGFVDAHIHIESSMLVPSEFARLAVLHGTVATVSDPHEIANVLGVEGVEYMIDNGSRVPLKFFFGVPSCVPATSFETAGAVIDSPQVEALLQREELRYLAEMMNYPGVLHGDPEVLAKVAAAQRLGKPVDGHAPGLMGEEALRYIRAGISTDHECFTEEEARGKLKAGMRVLIREGSAAKNFDALIGLLPQYYERMMFCSDDKHPDELLLGHIDRLVARAVAMGLDLFQVLWVACINPVSHYALPVGSLREGDPADFIVVEDLREFQVMETWIDGALVAKDGQALFDEPLISCPNRFAVREKHPADFRLPYQGPAARVIGVRDGELITDDLHVQLPPANTAFQESDTERDILKITVVNRYADAPPAVALVHGFGLKSGAIASSVAHDSHNIICVGTDDDSICAAVNAIISHRGGIAVIGPPQNRVLPLPVAGIMSDREGRWVAAEYAEIDRLAKALGCQLSAPFMSLSFMALLVIPSLKLSDKGLFDGTAFDFVKNTNPK